MHTTLIVKPRTLPALALRGGGDGRGERVEKEEGGGREEDKYRLIMCHRSLTIH